MSETTKPETWPIGTVHASTKAKGPAQVTRPDDSTQTVNPNIDGIVFVVLDVPGEFTITLDGKTTTLVAA